MKKKVILVGGFHEIVELCEDNGYSIVGIIDNFLENQFMEYSILGHDEDAISLFKIYGHIPLILTPDSPIIRSKLFDFYKSIGFNFTSLISKDARVSRYSKIGYGTIIQSGVNVSSFASIGNFVKLNTNVNIMHDSNIENFVTIAPNAVVLGRVEINTKVYLGANSTVLPKIQITKNTIIGAGAVVTKDIKDSGTYVGIPAKQIK